MPPLLAQIAFSRVSKQYRVRICQMRWHYMSPRALISWRALRMTGAMYADLVLVCPDDDGPGLRRQLELDQSERGSRYSAELHQSDHCCTDWRLDADGRRCGGQRQRD